MSFHTKRSPSQAKRFMACPGALALCDSIPEDMRAGSGPAAQLGTATHGLIERCLKEGSEPEKYRGRIIELIGDEERVSLLRTGAKLPGRGRVVFEVDSDMIESATVMTDYVRERCAALKIAESELQLETRTNPLPERDDTSGTADVTIDGWPTILEVIDYKNGWNTVDHEANEQLLAYLLGKAIESGFAHEEYRVTVVQPNAPHESGAVRSDPVTAKELRKFQGRYRAAIERCEEAEHAFAKAKPPKGRKVNEAWAAKHLAAGDHCLFCDAQAFCPARHKLAERDAQIDFDDDPAELPEPVTEHEAARILAWADRMDALIRATSAYALRAMQAGHAVPGQKVVRRQTRRAFRDDIDESKLVTAIVKGKFVAKREALFSPPKLLSGPQVEKLVPKERRADFGKAFLVKPEGALTIAPENDPRPAVPVGPQADFNDDFE